MLEKLKTLFSFAPVVNFVDYEDGLLSVTSGKALSFEATAVKFKTSDATFVARVLVESFDEDSLVYRLKILEKEMVLDKLNVERRENPRLPKVLRVTSQHFPGFTGTTEDISVTGARVTTSGPLEVTHDIMVKIELDDQESVPFSVYADVAWTGAKFDGTYHSGLRFQSMDRKTQDTVRHYIATRMKIEKKLHTLEDVDPLI